MRGRLAGGPVFSGLGEEIGSAMALGLRNLSGSPVGGKTGGGKAGRVACRWRPASATDTLSPMSTDSRSERYRLAVLIDADNASARIADGLFEEIAKLGEASVR